MNFSEKIKIHNEIKQSIEDFLYKYGNWRDVGGWHWDFSGEYEVGGKEIHAQFNLSGPYGATDNECVSIPANYLEMEEKEWQELETEKLKKEVIAREKEREEKKKIEEEEREQKKYEEYLKLKEKYEKKE